MAKNSNSSQDETEDTKVSLLSLKPSTQLLSKNQLATLLGNLIDDCQEMNDDFSIMKKEVKILTKQKIGLELEYKDLLNDWKELVKKNDEL